MKRPKEVRPRIGQGRRSTKLQLNLLEWREVERSRHIINKAARVLTLSE